MGPYMVTKTAAQPFLSQPTPYFFPSSKTTKVALAALALFVVGWILMRHLSKKRVQPPPRDYVPPFVKQQPRATVDKGYPENLVKVLGGIEKFNQLSNLTVKEGDLQYATEGKKPYLTIQPKEMSSPIMKGVDTLGRPFLAVRFKQKRSQDLKVDVFLCRDPEASRWYLNEHGAEENFQMQKGQSLYFLQQLIENSHPAYELA
jgi:hypothetical protein